MRNCGIISEYRTENDVHEPVVAYLNSGYFFRSLNAELIGQDVQKHKKEGNKANEMSEKR